MLGTVSSRGEASRSYAKMAGMTPDQTLRGSAGALPARSAGDPTPGDVWVLVGNKKGDNAQIDILVERLGWTCTQKFVEMKPAFEKGKPRYRPSLDHIDLSRSDPLEPPWPDLILTVGRRPSMVALWIREQSGGRTRIILLGKPSGMLRHFDLVILSGEVQIPALPNVLKIGLPLMRANPEALERAAAEWRARLEGMPRPLVAVLVGGPTHPFVYDDSVTAQLLAVAERVRAEGGSTWFTTSRRTPDGVAAALRDALPAGARLFDWKTADAQENPYLGLLALADRFVVTGDSLSMLVEVARLGRPLAYVPLPMGLRGSVDQLRRGLARRLFSPPGESAASRLRERLGKALHRSGILGHTRDFTAVHDLLVDRGLARPVAQGFSDPGGAAADDLDLAVERIQALVDGWREGV